jgi:hypothetical protein
MMYDREKVSKEVLFFMTEENCSLRQACKNAGVPFGTFLGWVDADPVLAEQYTRARTILLEHMAEDTLLIADEAVGSLDNGGTDSGAVAKQRLQVDTRKWLLSKLAPRKYGEKITQEVTGADGGPVQFQQVRRIIVDPNGNP